MNISTFSQNVLSRDLVPFTIFLNARLKDELKVICIHSAFKVVAKPIYVVGEVKSTFSKLGKTLLVAAGDSLPLLFGEISVEQAPHLQLLLQGELSDLVDQGVELHGVVSFQWVAVSSWVALLAAYHGLRARAIPPEMVENQGLEEARKIPGFHDKTLGGSRQGQRSIRLSQAYRAIYEIDTDAAGELARVKEVTNHEY